MKKKTIRKQLLAWVLAGAMMPQSSIAYAAETAASVLAPKEDILVRWLPEKDQIKAGEEGKVTLEARLNTKRSKVDRAEIEIHLEPEEARALRLEVFDNAEETVDWKDDGSADLYFELDTEHKKLSQKLTFVVPEEVEELFDIDVDRDDITVTPYGDFEDAASTDSQETFSTATPSSIETPSIATPSTTTPSIATPSTATPSTATSSNSSDNTRTDVEIDGGVRIRIETRILHVIGEVPEYDLSVTAVEQADEKGTDCFQFQIDAVKQEAPSALAVKEQSLSMKLELPEWVSIQQQNITWNQTTNRLQIDGTDLAEITGIPDSMKVTSAKVSDPQTLEVQMEKAETEDIHLEVSLFHASPLLQISEEVKTAVEHGEPAEAVEGQIALSAVLTTTAAGQSTEDEDRAVKSISLADLLKDEATAVITQTTSLNKQLFWIDNRNESQIRPKTTGEYLQRFKPAITFKVEGETGEIAFTEENWRKYFGNATMPQLEVSGSLDQISFNDAPTQATWTSPYDETSKTCSITWAMKQTNLEDMGEDGKPNYSGKYSISSLDTERNGNKEGWYYIERRTLTFDIQLRIASLIPSDAAAQSRFWDEFGTSLQKVLGKRYNFYMETSFGPYNYSFQQILDGRSSGTISGDFTYHLSLGAMWKYDLSGAPVVYSLKDNGSEGTQKDKLTYEELLDADGNSILSDSDDFLEVIYNNDKVGNFGSVTDALYGGGTMLLQLRGIRNYQATKEWADAADPSNRPGGELQLWRYREGNDYSQASPVRDENGDIKTIQLDTNQNSQSINFGDLERYDPEGYLYRYVVKEFSNASNSYERVFGRIQVDPATGKEIIQDRIAGQNVSRTYPEQRSGENARNTWLYDGGVLTNRLNKQVTVTGTKIWEASTFQDELSNVEVQMTLYYKVKGSAEENVWKKVTQPAEVTETLTNFRAENESGMQVSRTMPLYDAQGQELIYRWFETKTAQNGMDNGFEKAPEVIDDMAKINQSFSLEHRGQMVSYVSENTFNEATGVSTIYNRLVDTRDYVVEKQWEGVEPKDITFYLHRTTGGLKNETLGSFSFKKDGSLAEENTLSPITVEQPETWRVKLRDLPRYDEKGRTYEYFLAESDSSESLPVYDLQVDEDGTYSSLIVNRPADGTSNSIMIHKDWIDDGDSVHRSPVTVGVYDKLTNVQIGDDVVIGDNEIWIRQVSIGEEKPSDVYVVEKKVGEEDVLKDEQGNSLTPQQTQTDGKQVYQTKQHEYKVSYTKPDQADPVGKSVFTIKNRRVGSVNFTLTKKWVDGDGSIRTAIKKAVDQINQSATDPSHQIHWILQLGFSSIPDTSEYPGGITKGDYQLTRTKASGDTVTINQDGAIPIYKDDAGTAGNSWYDLLENQGSGTSQTVEYHFYHLPKYDYAGAVMNYQAAEIWVDGNGNPADLAKYTYLEDGIRKSLAALLADYQSAYTKNEYVVGDRHTNDSQTVEITNRLTAVKNIHWHKQWHDNYNYDSQLRPDIYLDIYRKSDAPDSQLEEYEDDYQWTYQNASAHPDSSISKRHHWVANIYDVDKYDAQGYEWHYYAKEKTKVDKSKFDYTEVQYSRWSDENDPSTEKNLGTESNPAADAGKQVQPIPGTTEYALGENGTFINSIAGTVVIDGQKIWTGLPSAYLTDPVNRLPAATFYIDQTVEVFDEENNQTSTQTNQVATLPIENWDDIKDSSGFYKFSLKYTGNYTVDSKGIHAATDSSVKLFPRYNERGDLYTYSVRETLKWADSWPAGQERGDISDVYMTTIQTFLVTNSYNSVKGALRIKKYLSLPKSLESSRCPAVSMILTRSYQKADGTWVKDSEFKKEQVWNAGDVKTAFEAAKPGAVAGNNVVLCSTKQTKDPFLFENLDIYAPNGAKYQYQVEEKRDDYLYGFHTWAGAGDRTDGEVKTDSHLGRYVVTDLYPTMNQADAAGKKGRGTTSGSVPVTATYRNELQTEGETVELSGTKEWDEYTFQSSIRPMENEFAGWLKLYRSARSQPGQNNAIAEEPVEDAKFNVTVEAGGDGKTYRYTVKGTTDGSNLARYAPNGMLWNYVVKETIPDGSPYQAKDRKTTAKEQSSLTDSGSGVTTITLKPLTNTTKINVSYSKTWVDENGNAIQDDYAGLGTLKVTFKLQVKEQGQTSWTDAKTYFTGTKDLTGVVDFEPSISGSLTSDVWGKDHWIKDLPAFVLSGTTVIPLSYRIIETAVYQNGSETPLVTWTEKDKSNGLGYTLIGSGAATALITPYYLNGEYKLNDNNNHFNKLELGTMTVKKTWFNDRNNLWSTRQPTKRPGYHWELKLLIQRKTEGETDWSNVKSYDKNGNAKGDLLVTFYGTNQDAQMSRTITGLTACNEKGVPYTYRAVELDPENNQGLEENASYRKTYQVSYVSNDITVNTEASNTLQTVEIRAAKSWLADDSKGKTVTLQLKYLGTDGKLHAIGNLSGAKVTLDGTKDTPPDDNSAQFGYEEDAWKAVWTVPKVLPAELFTDQNAKAAVDTESGSTIYVVEELNSDDSDHTGYRQLSNTTDDHRNYAITNEKLMKLSIQKIWYTVNNNAKKPLTFQIYRIAGAAEIPAGDRGAKLLGTVTLTGSAQAQTWSWSGYSCTGTDAAGTKQFFSKYNSSGTPYLYYAREIAIGGQSIGEDRKVTVNGFRYEVVAPTVKMVSPASAQGGVTDPDTASASFINLQLTDIPVTKVWMDHNNAYGTRPENLELQLWRETKTKPGGMTDWDQVFITPEIQKDDSSGKWVYTWRDVPYYNPVDGKSFRYQVQEKVPPISTPTDAGAAGAWYASGNVTTGDVATAGIFGKGTITNTLKGQIQVTGTKIWKDENRTSRPSDITLTLYRWSDRSSEVNREEVTTANVPAMTLTWDKTNTNEWKYTYSNLPQFDSYGALYHYKVEETTPAHYRTEYKDALGREIHNLGLVTVHVEKKWEAENSAQKEITVGIYRTTELTIPADSLKDGTGSSVLIGQVTLNSGNNWEWSGDSLHGTTFDQRTYGEAEEKPYLYYARELQIGSTGVPAGGAGRLAEVEADGYRYRYAVKEEMTPSALTKGQAVPDSMTTVITNTQLTDLTVVKNWMDNNNQYRTRPDTPDDLKLTLYRKAEDDTDFTKLTDTELTGITVEKTAGTGAEVNRWTYTWKNLPATDQDGKSYTYYVWETVPAVNPDSTLHGAAYGGRQYVCSQGTDPAYPTEIRKDADTGKTNISRHADLTNVLTAHGISLSGTKLWADGEVDRPDTLGLRLLRRLDGETTETEISYETKAAGSTANPQLLWSKSGSTWTYTFINLDGYDARGVRYHYRIGEIVPDGYRNVVLADADGSGLEDLVNIRQVQFQVEKKWRVREDSVKHPVHMKLYRTTTGQIPETSVGDAASEFLGEVSLEEANSWKWSGDQITDANGNLIYFDKYRVLDEHGQLLSAPEQYLYYAREIVTDTGFLVTEAASLATASNATAVVTNQQLTDLTVVKEWLDHGNAYKTRPDHLELILYRQTEGGHREKITDRSPEVKKSAGNQWVYTWKDMPVQDVDGNPYTYDVEEQAPTLAEGARLLDASYVCLENQPVKLTNDQGKLTNYLKKETDLVGRKTWNDGQYAGRPTTVQLHLYRQADGESTWEEVTGAMPVWYRNSDDTWSFVYEKISRTNGSGAVYRYKVEEEVPKDYRVYDSKDSDGNQVFLENVGDGSLTLTKEVTGSGGELFREFHFTITVGTLPDGSRLPDGVYGGVSFRDGKAEITLKSGESVRADHLPGMVSYTVTEEEANLDRYRTTSEADQGVIQPFAVMEVKFTNSRTSDDKDRPVKPFPANTTTTGSDPGAISGPAQTEQADDQNEKPENHIGLWVIPKTGDETPILRDILILAAAVAMLAVLLIFRKKKKK